MIPMGTELSHFYHGLPFQNTRVGFHLTSSVFTFSSEELVFSAILYDILSVLFFYHQEHLYTLNSTTAHQMTVCPEFQIRELRNTATDKTVFILFTRNQFLNNSIVLVKRCYSQDTEKNRQAEIFGVDALHRFGDSCNVRIDHTAQKVPIT